jgi:hypothetical protein
MNAEAKEKPIRELLQDISHTMNSHSDFSNPSRGVISPKRMNRICFFAWLLALVLIAGTLVAMIWESIDPELGMKYIGSVCVVLLALLIFRSVNGVFVD